jgi:peptide/nickel transport system substrate-binding protein
MLLPGASAQEEEKPEFGGTYIMGLAEDPPTLTGVFSTATLTQYVCPKPYSALLFPDFDLNPTPDLAESWDVSADGLTYTFHLVHNATFHDGTPVTSADVKFSWDEVFMPYGIMAGTIGIYVDSVSTSDDYTVVFHLNQPFAPLLKFLPVWYFPILPKHLYEGTDIPNNPHNTAPIGSGPFKFKEWVKGDHITFERYDNYFRTDKWGRRLPYLDRVIFKIIPDPTAMTLAYERGEIDAIVHVAVARALVDTMLKAPNASVFWTPSAWFATRDIIFQVQRPIVNNTLVRHAIAHAIDRQELFEKCVYSQGAVNATIGPPSTMGDWYNPNQKKYEYDPAKAEQLLDQAGYPRGTGGVRFELRLSYPYYDPSVATAAELLVEMLDEVGIAIELVPGDAATWRKVTYTDWDFDISITMPGKGPDPGVQTSRFFVSWNQRHVAYSNVGYNNSEVDALFIELNEETNHAERVQILYDIVDILAEDLPMYIMWEQRYPFLYKDTFVNAYTTPWLNERGDEMWYIAPAEEEEAAPIPWEIIVVAVVIIAVVLVVVAFWVGRRKKS